MAHRQQNQARRVSDEFGASPSRVLRRDTSAASEAKRRDFGAPLRFVMAGGGTAMERIAEQQPSGLYRQPARERGWIDAMHAIGGTLARWNQRARQRRDLAELDDRLLHDIGVTRAQADYESNKSFWR
jgi:uncharacterized protein YjiS (DUF1127 family)